MDMASDSGLGLGGLEVDAKTLLAQWEAFGNSSAGRVQTNEGKANRLMLKQAVELLAYGCTKTALLMNYDPPFVPLKKPSAPAEDPLTAARRAIREMAVKRGVSRRAAAYMIENDVLMRGVKAAADLPRWVEQGGGRMRVGRGTSRRPTDDALDILCADDLPRESAA
jgi:hypothetical protein